MLKRLSTFFYGSMFLRQCSLCAIAGLLGISFAPINVWADIDLCNCESTSMSSVNDANDSQVIISSEEIITANTDNQNDSDEVLPTENEESDSFTLFSARASEEVQGCTIAQINVYEEQSVDADVVMTLEVGTSIRLNKINNGWGSATLKGKTVYLPINSRNFVAYDPIDDKEHEGTVVDARVTVVRAPSSSASTVETFPVGTGMHFKSFNKDYYMASYHGETVYIPTKHIELYTATSTKILQVYAKEAGVNIYSAPSKSSQICAHFNFGQMLYVRPFNNAWYVGSFNHKTVYIPIDQTSKDSPVGNITYTNYNISLSTMVSRQNDGQRMTTRDGYWVKASTSDIRNRVNPNNYIPGTSGFYQFMRLDVSCNVTSGQLNSYLSGMGTLSGQGSAFKEGAKNAHANELYLVAHAIHETGRGSSTLAQGVWYNPHTDKVQNSAGNGAVKVYNMYGIGAVDHDVIHGGAKAAYKNGWTTPAKAISGGASYVGNNYIASGRTTMSGQNTLYKMLWHPEAAAKNPSNLWHRYATDVSWAVNQGYYLNQMHQKFSGVMLTFDVPRFL